jgi:CHASE3 domain sensor protein
LAAENAETGQRGFVITGMTLPQPVYSSIRAHHPGLETMLRDDRSQLKRVGVLRRLLGEKFEELRFTIEQHRLHGFEASRVVVENHSRKKIMDEIRESVSEIDQAEQALLFTANKATEEQPTRNSRRWYRNCNSFHCHASSRGGVATTNSKEKLDRL